MPMTLRAKTAEDILYRRIGTCIVCRDRDATEGDSTCHVCRARLREWDDGCPTREAACTCRPRPGERVNGRGAKAQGHMVGCPAGRRP